MLKNKLLIVAGPTAVGKTDTAIGLARRLNGEIISADSMQIYKYMNIGTAKPSIEEQGGIPHHLVDCIYPDEDFSVAEFQSRAEELIGGIAEKGKLPIVAGGTGLYVNSLVCKMDFTSTASNWQLRNKLEEEARTNGHIFLHERLKALDPRAAERIHPNNLKRVIRAIEVNIEGGENIGDFTKDAKLNPNYDICMIGLTREREELYQRINLRVDSMLQLGLVEEVRSLLDKGYSKDLIAFKGLGYKEIIGYLEGEYDLAYAIEMLKRDSRRYAKRQLTWFRRYKDINWFNVSCYSSRQKLIDDIVEVVEGHFHFL